MLSTLGSEGSKVKHRFADGQTFIAYVLGEAAPFIFKWEEQAILSAVLQEVE